MRINHSGSIFGKFGTGQSPGLREGRRYPQKTAGGTAREVRVRCKSEGPRQHSAEAGRVTMEKHGGNGR